MLSHADVAGERQPEPYIQSRAVAEKAYFSPNNRWIAYVSAESGRSEVYVQTTEAGEFGRKGEVDRIESRGDQSALAARFQGIVLSLRPDGKVMAVDVPGNGPFQPGAPHALFQGPARSAVRGGNDSSPSYDVTADGKRFLFLVPDLDNTRVPFTVLLNWTTAIKE